jgi:LAO/AO transport system kinase
LAVNKADGDHVADAELAAQELAGALHLIHPPEAAWVPPVLTCSGETGRGLDEVWAVIERHRAVQESSGELEARRGRQRVEWMWAMVRERVLAAFTDRPDVRERAGRLERELRAGTTTATLAARELLADR